jgi:hypothetical protein
MNDESRALRQELTKVCDAYKELLADKDTVDFRLGSPEPYADAEPGIDPEQVYEVESESLNDNIRETVVKMIEVGQRIKRLEGF